MSFHNFATNLNKTLFDFSYGYYTHKVNDFFESRFGVKKVLLTMKVLDVESAFHINLLMFLIIEY